MPLMSCWTKTSMRRPPAPAGLLNAVPAPAAPRIRPTDDFIRFLAGLRRAATARCAAVTADWCGGRGVAILPRDENEPRTADPCGRCVVHLFRVGARGGPGAATRHADRPRAALARQSRHRGARCAAGAAAHSAC